MRMSLSALALLLAACGADGPPRFQEQEPVHPGVTMSGDARIGIVVTR